MKGVVSLNESYELIIAAKRETWEAHNVRFLHLPTVDLTKAPSLENLVEGVSFIKDVAASGGTSYVHCKAGRSRSATLVSCYIMKVSLS